MIHTASGLRHALLSAFLFCWPLLVECLRELFRTKHGLDDFI